MDENPKSQSRLNKSKSTLASAALNLKSASKFRNFEPSSGRHDDAGARNPQSVNNSQKETSTRKCALWPYNTRLVSPTNPHKPSSPRARTSQLPSPPNRPTKP